MRWMSIERPLSNPITNSLPRREMPVIVAPSIADGGGSKDRSALMPGVSTDSTRAPVTAEPIRRAVISTSGSSGSGLPEGLVSAANCSQGFRLALGPRPRLQPMSELLAVFGPNDSDSELITEIERLHPARVTVLLDGVDFDWAMDEGPTGEALRERMAALLTLIERRTGATVTGLAGDPHQLDGWRFDREVSARHAVAA